jgi:hypothetical protein
MDHVVGGLWQATGCDRSEFTAAFAQWMVKRKLTPAEFSWITGIMESTPTGIILSDFLSREKTE